MALLTIGISGGGEFGDRMRRLAAELKKAERDATNKGALLMQTRWKRALSGEILKVQTQAYRVSVNFTQAAEGPNGYESRVGAGGNASKYVAIHETGGTIYAKGRLLAIPVGDALTRSKAGARTGVARSVSPEDYRAQGGFWLSGGRLPIFVVPSGRGGRDLNVLFVGKPSVTIPARRPMGRSFDEVKPLIPRIAEEEAAKAVARVR